MVLYYFQRQSFIQHKSVPGFFNQKLWISIRYWFLPLVAYLFCLYTIAFNKKSLGILIFVMGILVHPFVAIPISVFFKWLDKVCNYIGKNVEDPKNEGKFLKLKKCFSVCTIMFYLALILITGYCLLFQWINFRETQIDDCSYNRTRENCEKLFISRNTFYSRTFNQCDCFEDKCIKIKSILGNIEKIISKMSICA